MRLVTKKISSIEVNDAATGAEAKAFRLSHGISMRSVAREMGYSAPYISDLEAGNRGWTKELLFRFESAVRKVSTEMKMASIRQATATAPNALKIGGKR